MVLFGHIGKEVYKILTEKGDSNWNTVTCVWRKNKSLSDYHNCWGKESLLDQLSLVFQSDCAKTKMLLLLDDLLQKLFWFQFECLILPI